MGNEKTLENQGIDTRFDLRERSDIPFWTLLCGEAETTSKIKSLESNCDIQRERWILSAIPTRRILIISLLAPCDSQVTVNFESPFWSVASSLICNLLAPKLWTITFMPLLSALSKCAVDGDFQVKEAPEFTFNVPYLLTLSPWRKKHLLLV